MIEAFLLSVAQLGDRAFLRVLAKSLALTLVLLAALGAMLAWGARWIARDGFALGDGAGALAAMAAILIAVGLAWLLFRVVAIAVIGIFADEVVEAVEARHYPAALATARPVPFARSTAMGLRSAARAIGVNLLFAPLYLVLLATGIGTPVALFVVNGWLLGRDLSDMVAARHLSPAAMRADRKATGGRRFALGLLGTGLLVVPFVNFVAPLLGAAMATHRFHRRNVKGEVSSVPPLPPSSRR
jgi:uncharacterized protein involved in cysteine biosynthesis